MKAMKLIFLLLMVGLLYSCDDSNCTDGMGSIQSIDLEQTNFRNISVEGAVDIELTQGSTYSTILEVEQNIFSLLDISVSNNTLFIEVRNGKCISPSRNMVLKVTAPDFNQIAAAGSANIVSIGELDIDQLSLVIAGAANSTISGSVGTQRFAIDGSAQIRHFDMISDNTTLEVNGSGNFEVYAEDALNLVVNGSATVKYKGMPQITQEVNGSANIIDSN